MTRKMYTKNFQVAKKIYDRVINLYHLLGIPYITLFRYVYDTYMHVRHFT